MRKRCDSRGERDIAVRLMDSIRVGAASTKANAVPMVVLWLLAASSVAVYYRVPGAADAFEPLAKWQTDSGWTAAFLNRVVFCGLVPGAFLLCVKQIRPLRPMLTVVVYCLWGGCWGIACDAFYTLQAHLFGSGTDAATLVKKTLVDQLVWNVFICTPVNALFFPWVANDFHRGPMLDWGTFLRRDCLNILVANWIVWVPVTVAVYAFPLPLQIQLVGFACSFWMLVALRVAAKGGAR